MLIYFLSRCQLAWIMRMVRVINQALINTRTTHSCRSQGSIQVTCPILYSLVFSVCIYANFPCVLQVGSRKARFSYPMSSSSRPDRTDFSGGHDATEPQPRPWTSGAGNNKRPPQQIFASGFWAERAWICFVLHILVILGRNNSRR